MSRWMSEPTTGQVMCDECACDVTWETIIPRHRSPLGVGTCAACGVRGFHYWEATEDEIGPLFVKGES